MAERRGEAWQRAIWLAMAERRVSFYCMVHLGQPLPNTYTPYKNTHRPGGTLGDAGGPSAVTAETQREQREMRDERDLESR